MLLHPSAQQEQLTKVLGSQVAPGFIDEIMSYNSLTTLVSVVFESPLYFSTKMQVIHLSLDCLCKLENPASQERPIFPQNNFKESSRNSACVCHHVVGVGHEGEGVHPAPGDVCLK